MTRYLSAFLLVLTVIGLLCSPAWAQNQAAAEALFRSAREAAEQGDWVTACDRFEESYRLEPAPGTVLNIARCREKLEQWASAWKRYEEAAQRLPGEDQRAKFARDKAQEIEPRIPHLILRPRDWDEEATVSVDGVPLRSATFGVPLPFNPGKHKILVHLEGRADQEQEIRLAEAERLEVVLELGPPLDSSPEMGDKQRARKDQGPPRPRAKGFGIGLLSVGIGGGLLALAGGTWAVVELGKVNDNCADKSCNQEGMDASARGRTAVILAGSGSVVAAVGLSLGAYFLAKASPEVEVAFTPSPDGARLTVRKSLW